MLHSTASHVGLAINSTALTLYPTITFWYCEKYLDAVNAHILKAYYFEVNKTAGTP